MTIFPNLRSLGIHKFKYRVVKVGEMLKNKHFRMNFTRIILLIM